MSFLISFLMAVFSIFWLDLLVFDVRIIAGLFLGGFLCFFISWFFCKRFWGGKKIFGLFLGVFLGVLLAFLRVGVVEMLANEKIMSVADFATEKGVDVKISGKIVEGVDVRTDKQKITVMVREVGVKNGEMSPTEGKIIANVSRFLEIQPKFGDEVVLRGRLKIPFENEDFSYKKFLALQNIFAWMPRAQIVEMKSGNLNVGEKILAKIYDFRGFLTRRFEKIFHEPEASLAAGILVGSRRGMPKKVEKAFVATGLMHIVAVSGSNITMVIVAAMWLFARFGRRRAMILSLVSVAIFVLTVGFSAAVMRAALMGSLAMVGKYFGRQADAMRLLLVVGFVMSLWNPHILTDDVGFQLSFLATMGLILFSGFFEMRLGWIPERFGLREAAALTFAAEIMVLPVVMQNFGLISFISPLANVIILPLTVPAMLLSFLSLGMPGIFGFFAHLNLRLIVVITEWLAKVPYAAVEVGKFGVLGIAFWYFGVWWFWESVKGKN